ncbi:MAG: hypothetical protein AAGA95_10555 [Pseudomonadota bacterium]
MTHAEIITALRELLEAEHRNTITVKPLEDGPQTTVNFKGLDGRQVAGLSLYRSPEGLRFQGFIRGIPPGRRQFEDAKALYADGKSIGRDPFKRGWK